MHYHCLKVTKFNVWSNKDLSFFSILIHLFFFNQRNSLTYDNKRFRFKVSSSKRSLIISKLFWLFVVLCSLLVYQFTNPHAESYTQTYNNNDSGSEYWTRCFNTEIGESVYLALMLVVPKCNQYNLHNSIFSSFLSTNTPLSHEARMSSHSIHTSHIPINK